MTSLIISNGHGEDEVGVNFARELGTQVCAAPLVGHGKSYQNAKIPLCITPVMMPSGGVLDSLKSIVNDIRAGLLSAHFRHWRQLARLEDMDQVFAIGDSVALAFSFAVKARTRLFLPTAKSDYIAPHNRIEISLMKAMDWVFPRDQKTQKTLAKKGIKARYVGNVLMDEMKKSTTNLGLGSANKVLGILPGSRADLYDNLVLVLDRLSPIVPPQDHWTIWVARPPQADAQKIDNIIRATKLDVRQGDLADVLTWAQVCIGLAGTANERVAFAGIPLVAFEGVGRTSRINRFVIQKKLLGNALTLIHPFSSDQLAKALHNGIQKTKSITTPWAGLKTYQKILQIVG